MRLPSRARLPRRRHIAGEVWVPRSEVSSYELRCRRCRLPPCMTGHTHPQPHPRWSPWRSPAQYLSKLLFFTLTQFNEFVKITFGTLCLLVAEAIPIPILIPIPMAPSSSNFDSSAESTSRVTL